MSYPKNEAVTCYRPKTVNWRNESHEGTYQERIYLHPRGAILWAYVRQIVADSSVQNDAVDPIQRFLVVVNQRPELEYRIGDCFNWKGKTLKVISAPDIYDGKGDVKLTCECVETDKTISRREIFLKWGQRP